MREELVNFVLENELSLFSSSKSVLKSMGKSIHKTKDAKLIHNRVSTKVSSGFVFSETSNVWNNFDFVDDFEEIKKRQGFFSGLKDEELCSENVLSELKKPRASWKPKYDVVVVTEDEETFLKLNELNCAVQLLTNENDVLELERYDIVQAVDCDDFQMILERLPQSVFLNSYEDVYLERFLEELSGWQENFEILKNSGKVSGGIRVLLDELEPCFDLLENREGRIISEKEAERVLEEINDKISERIKSMTISGEGLMKMLSEGKMPEGILEILNKTIEESGLNEHIFNFTIPVSIDYKELEDQIKRQSALEFTDLAERVKRNARTLRKIPEILKKLSSEILIEDFCRGVLNWISSGKNYPTYSENLHFSGAKSIFIDNPQPIDFQLDVFNKCSILTGANSGGKTTLLEHILQGVSLFHLGLPVEGEIHLPIFSEVYYFAKNKGSASKGAFETLLTQMSKIGETGDFGNGKTLILADEIEAVTEPGIAGRIISATAEYFSNKGCFMVLATHLGTEIAKNLKEGMRIDGIEAKGLDENFNLIVNHNPVLGRLASSTPELIIEKMAGSFGNDYFDFLFKKVKYSDN